MKMLFSLFSAAVLAVSTSLPVQAEKLSDLVSQAGLEWMIGKWAGKSEDGQETKLRYEWKLDKHAVAVHYKGPEREMEGMIGRNPKNGEVGYFAIDNQGGGAMAKIDVEEGKMVMKVKFVTGEGNDGRVAVVHEKVDENTMKVVIRSLDEEGEVGDVLETVKLNRVTE